MEIITYDLAPQSVYTSPGLVPTDSPQVAGPYAHPKRLSLEHHANPRSSDPRYRFAALSVPYMVYKPSRILGALSINLYF